ncbi:MAG: DNA polymerase III subunit gamma/tau [Hyphomicrobiales bacterium]
MSSSKNDNQASTGYRVLARKYRPANFDELIGQDAMVKTLTNAFSSGRIAQAYMLTGVRGVGKTTTARLIARALNYEAEGVDAPTMQMEGAGEHCTAILESRHVDVIEMDAASNTGIDDVREIIEAVRYKPASARYKVYIIDEVHMLSKAAFNALLKTLEEPPEHVKFIFATTEIRKVPVTVLSRCQRFDLRRLEPDALSAHFAAIAEKESVSVEQEALSMIARASEGSVRDGLSLLDQAIAFGGAEVKADEVRAMLGLADRARIIDMLEQLMKGDVASVLKEFDDHHSRGAAPAVILTDLAQIVHWITRLKAVPDAADMGGHTETERARGKELAAALSMPVLTRAWQILLKGISEVNLAAYSLAAAEMVLIRMAYVADLPTPDAVIEKLQKEPRAKAAVPSAAPSALPASPQSEPAVEARSVSQAAPVSAPAEENTENPAPPPALASFQDVIKLAGERRDIKLKTELENYVRLIRFAPGQIECALEPDAPRGLPNALSRKLEQWTFTRWIISVSDEGGETPVADQTRAKRQNLFNEVRELPDVKAVLEKFPGAEIVDVTELVPPEIEGGLDDEDTNPGTSRTE